MKKQPKISSLKKEKEVILVKDLIGKDTILGRPIRLNRQRLDIKNGKNYAEVLFFGDLHYGHRACDIERAKRQLDYCLQKGIYILGMGDYIEAGLRDSVGDSVYEQELNPQKQMDFVVELFTPLTEKNLVLGLIIGNHENRILKNTSVNIVKMMSKMLRVPYLGAACWNLLYVGDQSYSIYALHGSTGSKFIYTKLKALVDISHNFDADILAMAHVHELADDAILVQELDKKRKMVVERKKYLIITGHYLTYDKTYAQEKGYPMGKLGSPKVKLFSEKKDIHISN